MNFHCFFSLCANSFYISVKKKMMKKYMFTAMALGLLLVGCGEEADSAKEVQGDTKVMNCLYSYNPANSELKWTAYKFLNKTGVGGSFTQINVSGAESTGDAHSLIESLSFVIPISSTETNDAGRNQKIQNFFFGSMASTEEIAGKVVSLGDNGRAILAITMNEITLEVEGDYSLDGARFMYSTEINVDDWNGQMGIKALNDECKDLHTDYENGDTESKLWSDVSISFSTTLTEICD
jgi:hypothetical protein